MIRTPVGHIFIGIIFSVASLWAVEWHVNLQKPREAKFISRAPLEEFEGTTQDIDGYLYWDDDSLFQNNEFYFEVNLNSIKTGIGLRDRHMRERYLETNKWPVASYKGKIIAYQPVDSAGTTYYKVQTEGEFSVHGVSRTIKVNGIITPFSEDELQVVASFAIELPDYNIEIPRVMIFKLDKHIKIHVQFFLKKVEG